MKVLFAVSDESVSQSIIKKYQQMYKEIITSKNVYYFNAIVKELQKDKTYDRIVISEDLEPFTNNNYETIDKFIFEKLDNISDEATTLQGEDISIILIATDRRTKSDNLLVKLFGIGVYSVLLGQDRNINELCKLIRKPRSKKEAKQYYNIKANDVDYKPESEGDVKESEIQSILTYFKRLGRNEERYVETFDNVASQYTDEQLKVIIKFLPLNVKAVLEENSPKYQQLVSYSNKNVKKLNDYKSSNKTKINNNTSKAIDNTGIKISSIPSGEKKLTKPVIIPSANRGKKVQETKKTQEKVQKPVVKEDKIIKQEEQNEVRKGRGRPKKSVAIEEKNIDEQPKRGRGRPRKEESDIKEISNIEDEEIKENVLPVFDDYEDEGKNIELPTFDEEEEEITLPSFDDDDEDEEETTLPSFDDDDEDEEEETTHPTFDDDDDEDEEEETTLPSFDEDDEDDEDETTLPTVDEEENEEEETTLPSFDDDDEDEEETTLPSFDDEEDEEEEETTLPSFDDDEDEKEETTLPSFDDDDEDEEEETTLPSFDDDDEDEEEETTLPSFDDDDEDEEETTLPSFDDDDEDEEEETTLPSFDDDEEDETTLPTVDEKEENEEEETTLPTVDDDEDEEDEELSQPSMPIQNYSNNSYSENQNKKEIQNYNKQPSVIEGLLTNNQKVVAFVGTSKNGTSFMVNNLAEIISNKGIKTAILDLTKNKNSYYIYTKNEEELRKTAYGCIEKLSKGTAQGIKVNNNLDVYTSLPGQDNFEEDYQNILETLVRNYSLVLLDCDFKSHYGYLNEAQEIYLVQSMDVLTIQPLTAYLRDLKAKDVLKQEKLKIIINKYTKIKGISEKAIIGGMAFYNDPAMAYMTELFNRELVPYCTIPFDSQVYAKYLEALINCNISVKGYSKEFTNYIQKLSEMVYPLIGNRKDG